MLQRLHQLLGGKAIFGKSVVSVMLSFLRTGLFSYQLSMFHICKLETLNFLTM